MLWVALAFIVVSGEAAAAQAPGVTAFASTDQSPGAISRSEKESPSLDPVHDWLYQGMQHWIERFDTWFATPGQSPLSVPPSSIRIGVETAMFRTQSGTSVVERPDVEATVRLPNIERRLRLFITSVDVQESPADPTRQASPVRFGMRVVPIAPVAFDVGVRTSIHPSAFATLRWSPQLNARGLTVSPFVKPYAESDLGAGVSAGMLVQRLRRRWLMRSSPYNNWLRSVSGASTATWSQTFMTGVVNATLPEQQYGSVAEGKDIACGIALRLYASGDTDSRASVYETSVIFKRQLYGGWLLGYVEPALHWERASRWHGDIGIRIGFDVFLSSAPRVTCP